MAGGYVGRILNVDLSTGEMYDEALDEGVCRAYLGGYGIGAKILWEKMRPGIDALGPENILGLMTGPLTGTPAIIGSRFTAFAKSPLTGTWGDANCGGFFGPHLKFAGYDGVVFYHASDRPVYLVIENGKAELRDASHLWGKNCGEVEDILTETHGAGVQVVSIGQSGESLSLISCIINDKGRAAGRSGLGAVMGAKKLKAVVVKGDGAVPLANPALAAQLRKDYVRKSAGLYDFFHDTGTCGTTAPSAMNGYSPVKNWAGVGPIDFPNAGRIDAESIMPIQEKKYFCWHCTLGCGGKMKGKASVYPAGTHKPEYETLCAFGTLCLNDNLDSIIIVNEICNQYGLDTISAGATVTFAIECYENGLIGKADTDGLDLTWGNAEAIIALTEKMARREGFGAVLADGVKVAAAKIGRGSEAYAVHIQGQELPMHDPRATKGLATTYQLDATPARHTQGSEMVPLPGLELGEFNLGEPYKKCVTMMHVINVAGLCQFGSYCYPIQSVPDFLQAVTGWDVTLDECFTIGERIANLRHAFNLREGLNPLKFHVPPRSIGVPPVKAGAVANVTIDIDAQNRAYTEAMEWDPVTAVPSAAKIESLGLGYLNKDLGPLRRR